MICPFTRRMSDHPTTCVPVCALWDKEKEQCLLAITARNIALAVDAIQLLIDPAQAVKDPFAEEDDDRIVMCRWCGRVQQDGKWEMPQRIPKDPKNTTRHQICPVCFEKEQRDVFSPESPLDDPVQEIDPEEVRHNDGE